MNLQCMSLDPDYESSASDLFMVADLVKIDIEARYYHTLIQILRIDAIQYIM